jgi:hypothetical protein
MSICKRFLPALTGLILSSTLAFGQAAKSPFSSIGLGEQFGNALTHNQGMGGVGLSTPQYWWLNNQNPALLVFNRITTFEAGLIGESRTQKAPGLTEHSGSGNLNYLALGIPIKPGKWTAALSLMPYSRLNYQQQRTDPVQGDTSVIHVLEKGSGGVNQFSFSNGYAVNKKISLGLKASYLFSAVVNEYSNLLMGTQQVLLISPNIYERTFVSDFQFTPAVSIHLDSLGKRKEYKFNVGLVYDFKTNLNSRFYQRIERRNVAGLVDSLTLISNQSGIITIPSKVSLGFSFSKLFKWTFAVDGTYSNYTQYRGLDGQNPYAGTAWSVAAGYEITPDIGSLGSYLKRMTYRTGVSLENSPYLANGNAVKDFGITFGLSLPVSRVSSLDLALKLGKRGDQTLNGVEESYLKLYFGMTFNDQWFIKRRFD